MVLFSLHNPGQRWLLPVLEYTGYRLVINIPAAVKDHGRVYVNKMLGALYMARLLFSYSIDSHVIMLGACCQCSFYIFDMGM